MRRDNKINKTALSIALALSLTVAVTTNVDASSNKVMWGKTELKLGQIGKVTILKDTDLVKIASDGSLTTVRKLSKGDEFRVYQYKGQHGGLYGVGNSSFVQKNGTKVLYETPSKSKLELVNVGKIEIPPVVEDVSNNDSTDDWVTIDTGKGIIVRVKNPVSENYLEEKLPAIHEKNLKAEKDFNKILGDDYKVNTEKRSQIVVAEKDGKDYFTYNYHEGIYQDNGQHHIFMNWEKNNETNKISYKLLKSVGFPLSEKEYNNRINQSEKEHEAILKDNIYIHAGGYLQIRW